MKTQSCPPRHVLAIATLALLLPLAPVAAAVSDPEGDASPPFLDITDVRVEADEVPSLTVVVEVADMSAAIPSGNVVITYNAEFCANNNLQAGQPICWQLNANDNNDVVTADFFRGRVRNADGSYCSVPGAVSSGSFDYASNAVRWTVSKAALDFTAVPANAMTCATGVRGGRALSDGDYLLGLRASTTMQTTGGVLVPVDQTASGSHFVNSPANFAPTLAVPGDQRLAEGSTVAFTLSATDPDADAVTFSATGLPGGATLDATSGAFAWTPGYDQEGDYVVTFHADDGQGGQDSGTVAFHVAHTNQAPVLAAIADVQAQRRTTITLQLAAVDADGDQVAYTAEGLPLGATLNPATGEFVWWASNQQVGDHAVTFRVTDGVLEDAQTVVFTITKH